TRTLADLARSVDQPPVRLEMERVAARAQRRDREVEREDPDDHQSSASPEPSMAGLQSNSGTGLELPELSIAWEALNRSGLISLCPGRLFSNQRRRPWHQTTRL